MAGFCNCPAIPPGASAEDIFLPSPESGGIGRLRRVADVELDHFLVALAVEVGRADPDLDLRRRLVIEQARIRDDQMVALDAERAAGGIGDERQRRTVSDADPSLCPRQAGDGVLSSCERRAVVLVARHDARQHPPHLVGRYG